MGLPGTTDVPLVLKVNQDREDESLKRKYVRLHGENVGVGYICSIYHPIEGAATKERNLTKRNSIQTGRRQSLRV